MNSKSAFFTLLLVSAGCSSEPVTNTPPAAELAQPSAADKPVLAQPSAADNPAADKAEKKDDALPDLTKETGCVLYHWSTIEPKWDREAADWNADTRTLSLLGSTRHFDEQGRVLDFGEGADKLEYDKAGNLVSRKGGKMGPATEYEYKNRYDKQGLLISVEVAMRPVKGKLSAFAPYRKYHYDAGRHVDQMDVQIVPNGPLLPVRVQNDAQGRVTQLTWSDAGAEKQVERFHYDASGRLASYERDGLVVPPGRPSDGKVEWTQTWEYGTDGQPKRMDAVEGTDAEKSPHETTLFSPGCTSLGKLWPDLYVFPYLPLPAAAGSRFMP